MSVEDIATAVSKTALSAAEPVAWINQQELRYLEMVSGNNGWGNHLRSVTLGGEEEGRSPLYAKPPAPFLAVKALEWQTFCSRSGNCAAHSPVGEYVIQNEDDLWLVYLPYQDKRWGKGHSTVEEAKAAAQSDYESRILSAISAQAQDVAGWQLVPVEPTEEMLERATVAFADAFDARLARKECLAAALSSAYRSAAPTKQEG